MVLGQDVDILRESKLLQSPFVDSGHGRKHVVVFPSVGAGAESGDVGAGVVVQIICLDEDGVCVHVDIIREAECLELRIVVAVIALDDLAVLVPQGSSATEHGHTVLGVIVQVRGPKRVTVLVAKLHQRPPELCEILVYIIIQTLAAEHSVVLDDLDIAESVDHVLVHIPQRGVAYQQGGVVLETGMA